MDGSVLCKKTRSQFVRDLLGLGRLTCKGQREGGSIEDVLAMGNLNRPKRAAPGFDFIVQKGVVPRRELFNLNP